MTSKAASDGSATQSGDLVRLEYDLWTETGGRTELLDTTHAETAQTAGVALQPGQVWGARPHLIGGEFFPKGIESALVGVAFGTELEREFPPAEAFGERDPNLIELFSMHEIERLPEMRRQDAHLDLGTVLTINGRRGRVTTLTAARVRVDFNPPFAGRKVRGKFKVLEKIVDRVEQARAVVELQYGHGSEFHVELHDKTLTIQVPDRTKFDPGWIVAKARVIDRLRSQLAPDVIRVVEEYASPREAKPAAPEKADEPTHASAPKEAEPADRHAKSPSPKRTGHSGGTAHAEKPEPS